MSESEMLKISIEEFDRIQDHMSSCEKADSPPMLETIAVKAYNGQRLWFKAIYTCKNYRMKSNFFSA